MSVPRESPDPSNAPAWTVSELSGALRRTVEEAFGFVRLRGEISGFRGPHSSGHCYFSLKDENARIDAVVWKGTFGRMRFRPEEGMEVVATGRVTTFPGKSSYQIIIDTLEPAGIGALMALLDERRRKLAAEGLFDEAKKKKLPFLPAVIGVVTSPTGAVIRDILHRLADRFPRRVIVWPVRVQGETAAAEVAAAIRGFDGLAPGGPIPRPDVLIVARGGGSLEDLWSFNEEVVVRAAAACRIPLVAAIGHETDWTLIDLVADRRAPTPTGAAEMVVPVRAELLDGLDGLARRHAGAMRRQAERARADLRSAARALPGPADLVAVPRQRLDLAGGRLGAALVSGLRRHERRFAEVQRRLAPVAPAERLRALRDRLAHLGPRLAGGLGRGLERRFRLFAPVAARLSRGLVTARVGRGGERLEALAARMKRCIRLGTERRADRFEALGQRLVNLSYKSVLARGYAVVRGADRRLVSSRAAVAPGARLAVEFADGAVDVTADGAAPKPRREPGGQGTLF